jgi:Tfp pilus assembly protein PilF
MDNVSAGTLQPDELKVYHYHLGAAYRMAGQIERARNELDTSLQYDPKYEEALAESKLLPSSSGGTP